MNWLKSLLSSDSRKSRRHAIPHLVSYYWDGESAAPTAHRVRNISADGLYLLTERRWYPGTLITVTLQMTRDSDDSETAIAVLSKVVRSGSDGVGFKFVFPSESQDTQSIHTTDGNRISDKKALQHFLQRVPKHAPPKNYAAKN